MRNCTWTLTRRRPPTSPAVVICPLRAPPSSTRVWRDQAVPRPGTNINTHNIYAHIHTCAGIFNSIHTLVYSWLCAHCARPSSTRVWRSQAVPRPGTNTNTHNTYARTYSHLRGHISLTRTPLYTAGSGGSKAGYEHEQHIRTHSHLRGLIHLHAHPYTHVAPRHTHTC